MRMASLVVAVLLTLAVAGCKSDNTMPPPPASVINNTRDRLNPYRFTFMTEPSSPTVNSRIVLKVHVIDAVNQPADGVDVEADLSMPGMSGPHVALNGVGGGDYEGEVTPEMAGSWDVDLTASKDGKTKKQRFYVDVGG